MVTQWQRALRPRPLAGPKPSLRALEMISRVPPAPPQPLLRIGDADYPAKHSAELSLAKMVVYLRDLALESPEVWGHAAAIADRLDGHRLEDLDRACFDSILQELRAAQNELKYSWTCPWLTTLTGARSYGDVIDTWLRKNRP